MIETDEQELKNQKFQNACRIWFCPAEDRIARELREMPQVEREKVWADLSGNEKTSQFRKDVQEDPDVISKALQAMKQEVEATTDKAALELAQKQSSEYVNHRSFHLMFLRSCEYDGKKAGQKIVQHFEMKLKLFGEDLLGRDILLSDLSDDDMETLSCGGMQFLSQRDSAGRLILFSHRHALQYKERENVCRALFYSLMTALQDETVQKLGIILVGNIMAEFTGGYTYEADMMQIQTASAVPFRPVARYIFFQSSLWNQVIDVWNHLITPSLRARTRTICGSYNEAMYALKCLGIPNEVIPTDEDGNATVDNLELWIAERRKKESLVRLQEPNANDTARKRRKLAA